MNLKNQKPIHEVDDPSAYNETLQDHPNPDRILIMQNQTINIFNLQTGRVNEVYNARTEIKQFLAMKNGDLLVATDRGITYLQMKEGEFYEKQSSFDKLKFVTCMRLTKAEDILVVGESGHKAEDNKVSKILIKQPSDGIFGGMNMLDA